jgi:hypothetical protein
VLGTAVKVVISVVAGHFVWAFATEHVIVAAVTLHLVTATAAEEPVRTHIPEEVVAT